MVVMYGCVVLSACVTVPQSPSECGWIYSVKLLENRLDPLPRALVRFPSMHAFSLHLL